MLPIDVEFQFKVDKNNDQTTTATTKNVDEGVVPQLYFTFYFISFQFAYNKHKTMNISELIRRMRWSRRYQNRENARVYDRWLTQ